MPRAQQPKIPTPREWRNLVRMARQGKRLATSPNATNDGEHDALVSLTDFILYVPKKKEAK